ncbi:MAG: hypothetical protein ACE5NG_06050, partial [bacterium]
GVDYAQWSALTKASIRKDFRESSLSTTLRHGRSGGRIFFTLVFFYFITGLIFVPIVLDNQDVFFTGTLLISYTMFMIGGLILVEYSTVVISPDDYSVLGYRPISSKTFFFVRLTNILFYILTFTTVLALPATVAFFFTLGFNPTLGVAAFLSVLLANIATAMTMVLLYTFILKKVSLNRLQNLLAFFQVGLAFLIYSSFFIIPRLVGNSVVQTSEMSSSLWLKFLPSAWFSSYLTISLGEPMPSDWLLAAISILMTVALAYFALSKVSMGYSESLAAVSTLPADKKVASRRFVKPFLLFAQAHEERVVSKLIRNQFLHDNKFKMAVLGILPLTIFYLFIGIEGGPLPDPFEIHEFDMKRTGLLYLLVFLFPMMLRTYVTQSDAFQASWIFYTTPANVRRLILSEKNFLMIYFVLPFLFILGMIFYYYFHNLLHVLLHLLVLGLLAHLFLQLAFLYSPDLPFSRANVKGSRTRNLAVLLILIPFTIYLILPLIFEFVYSEAASFVTFTITMLTVSVILESLIQVRVTIYMKKLEFTG